VSKDGLIVTNAHVVDNATSITVQLSGGTAQTARLVGKDDSTDVALLRIDPAGRTLKPLTFADSSTVQVGDAAYAIGNPYGLDHTLTTGVVSATRRRIDAPNGFSISGVIQTDAALNPGNSGGPLLDDQGRVIGINSQIETGSGQGGSSSGGNVGIGFAVPSNTVRRVVAALEAS
jgi:putative serine protease PepD